MKRKVHELKLAGLKAHGEAIRKKLLKLTKPLLQERFIDYENDLFVLIRCDIT